MAINKPANSSINFRFGTLGGYKDLTSKSPEDLYFVYTPNDGEDSSKVYGTIFVNDIMFGSKVFDLSINEGELYKGTDGKGIGGSYKDYPTMTFKKLSADGSALEDVSVAYISVNNFKTINEVVQVVEKKIETIEKLPDGAIDLLKNINVNGVDGSVKDNIASVTISAKNVSVGDGGLEGNTYYKDASTVAEALSSIAAAVKTTAESAGVSSLGGKTGDITLKGDNKGDNSVGVNLSIDTINGNNVMSATLVGFDSSTQAEADAYVNAVKLENGKVAVTTEKLSKGKLFFEVEDTFKNTSVGEFSENSNNNVGLKLNSGNESVFKITSTKDSTRNNVGVITFTPILDETGPSKDSSNLITSGKVYSAIEEAKKAVGVTLIKADNADAGFAATYRLVKTSDNSKQVGDSINIPKDYLVKSASIEEATENNKPVEGINAGDKYIDFVVNTKEGSGTEDHIYLNVKDLVDVYTAGNGISVTVSDGKNVISLKVDDNNNNGLYVDEDGLKLALAASTTKDGSIYYSSGAMSAEDKKKLDNIAENGITSVVVNGSTATVNNNTATVTITGDNTKVGGDSVIKDSSISTVIVDISTRLDKVENLLLWKGLSD